MVIRRSNYSPHSAASVEYEGVIYTSPPLLDADDLMSEWKVYRRAMLQEKDMMMAAKGGSHVTLMLTYFLRCLSSSRSFLWVLLWLNGALAK